MSYQEGVLQAFGHPLRYIEFIYTESEIELGVESFFKKEQMKVLQNYESLVSVVSMALGGKKGSGATPDNVVNIQSAAQLDNMIRSQLNGG